MIKTSIFTVLLTILSLLISAQTPIDIAENTLKVSPSGEEVFYYGLAEGDQLVFNFEEVNGKELKELEIAYLPSRIIFKDYKTSRIENKILNITETGIYKFRFVNTNILTGRICKFKIQRIPASEKTKKFNTTVYKRLTFDTTYYYEPEKYLRKDTSIIEVVNQTAKVHSKMNFNGNKTITNFRLPDNTVSWSYYIGVDQAGQQAFEKATQQLIVSSTPMVLKLVGSNPLTALAMGITSFLSQLQSGEDIDYYLLDGQNVNLFLNKKPFKAYKQGKVINDFSRMYPVLGTLSFCFSNDNAITGVSVFVKVTAIQVNSIWETRQIKKMKISTGAEEMYLKN